MAARLYQGKGGRQIHNDHVWPNAERVRGYATGATGFSDGCDMSVAEKTSPVSLHLNRYLVIIRSSIYLQLMFSATHTTDDSLDLSTDPSVGSAVYAKYGEASVAGFQAVPDLLLKHQRDLGLSATDLTVLLNVLMHWWYPGQKPFPRSTTIGKRMGVSPRTVQRSLQQLEDLGLLVREKDVRGPTYLDPMPLVEKLTALAKKDTDYLIRRRRRDGEEEPGPNRQPPG